MNRIPSHPATLLAFLTLLVAPLGAGASEPDIRRDATVLATEKVLPSVVNIATETVIARTEANAAWASVFPFR